MCREFLPFFSCYENKGFRQLQIIKPMMDSNKTPLEIDGSKSWKRILNLSFLSIIVSNVFFP